MTLIDPWDDFDPDEGDPYVLGRAEDGEIARWFGEDPPEHKRDDPPPEQITACPGTPGRHERSNDD